MKIITLEEELAIIAMDGKSISQVLLEAEQAAEQAEQDNAFEQYVSKKTQGNDRRFRQGKASEEYIRDIKAIDSLRRAASKYGLTNEFFNALRQAFPAEKDDKAQAILLASDDELLTNHIKETYQAANKIPTELDIKRDKEIIRKKAILTYDEFNDIVLSLREHFGPKLAAKKKIFQNIQTNANASYASMRSYVFEKTGQNIPDFNIEKILQKEPEKDVSITYKSGEKWVTEHISGAELLQNKISKLIEILKKLNKEHYSKVMKVFQGVAHALQGVGEAKGALDGYNLDPDAKTYIAYQYAYISAVDALNEIYHKESNPSEQPKQEKAPKQKKVDIVGTIRQKLSTISLENKNIIKNFLSKITLGGQQIDDIDNWIMARVKVLAAMMNDNDENKRKIAGEWITQITAKLDAMESTIPPPPTKTETSLPGAEDIIYSIKDKKYREDSPIYKQFVQDVPGVSETPMKLTALNGKEFTPQEIATPGTKGVRGQNFLWHITIQDIDGKPIITRAQNVKKLVTEEFDLSGSRKWLGSLEQRLNVI